MTKATQGARMGSRQVGVAGRKANALTPLTFEPPAEMSPVVAMFGNAGSAQLTAALLDLAHRGHLNVWFHHLDTERPRAVEDILFERNPSADGPLSDAETELLERVFSHGDCIAVDTLRRLAIRWPTKLPRSLAEKVNVPVPGATRRRRAPVLLGVLTGMLALIGGLGLTGLALLGVLDDPIMLGSGVLGVLVLVLIADRAWRRSRVRKVPVGEVLLAYRDLLQSALSGFSFRTAADYERVLGPHHPWAIALEVVPNWLDLPDSGPDPFAGRTGYEVKSVSVRRARTIPVVRHPASVRIAHRIPRPRRPVD